MAEDTNDNMEAVRAAVTEAVSKAIASASQAGAGARTSTGSEVTEGTSRGRVTSQYADVRTGQDVGADEAQSTGILKDQDVTQSYKQLGVNSATSLQAVLNQVSATRAQDTAFYDNVLRAAVTSMIRGRDVQAEDFAAMSVDRRWNLDEVNYLVEAILANSTFQEAIGAATAAAVAASVVGYSE